MSREKIARDRFLEHLFSIMMYGYQKEFSDIVISNTINRNAEEGNQEIARQAGKSLGFVLTEAFLSTHNDILYGEPIHVGFFAPRQEQVKTSFDKLKDMLPIAAEAFNMKFMEKNQGTLTMARPHFVGGRLINYKKVYTAYAMTLGEGTHVESKTMHRAYVDEAQDVDDFKVNKEVVPMLSAVGGNLYRIGVAGYRKCDFKRAVDEERNLVIADKDKVIEDREVMYKKTGDKKHLLWKQFVDKEVHKAGGEGVDYIRTQYLLQWITEKGNMTTKNKLDKCKQKFLCVGDNRVVLAADMAKKSDSTVLTASTVLGQRLRSWELIGQDYNDQYPAICEAAEWLEKKGYSVTRIRMDCTGGTGDAAGEALKAHPECKWNVEFFYFAPQNKHNLYQQFIGLIEVGCGIADGKIEEDTTPQRRFEYWAGDPNVERFEQQMLDMEKEYKGTEGNLLSCHHPDHAGAKDDHPDSTAMSVYIPADQEAPLGFEVL